MPLRIFSAKFATALSLCLDHVVEVKAAFRDLHKSEVISRLKTAARIDLELYGSS